MSERTTWDYLFDEREAWARDWLADPGEGPAVDLLAGMWGLDDAIANDCEFPDAAALARAREAVADAQRAAARAVARVALTRPDELERMLQEAIAREAIDAFDGLLRLGDGDRPWSDWQVEWPGQTRDELLRHAFTRRMVAENVAEQLRAKGAAATVAEGFPF